jgi:hypothetical protein
MGPGEEGKKRKRQKKNKSAAAGGAPSPNGAAALAPAAAAPPLPHQQPGTKRPLKGEPVGQSAPKKLKVATVDLMACLRSLKRLAR